MSPIGLVVLLATAAGAVIPQRPSAVDPTTRALIQALAPPLIHRYTDEGLWDWARLELDLQPNPYYVRGDFDGDGSADVAVYIRVLPHRVRGLAVLHGNVDKLRLFTEHRDLPPGPYLPRHPRIEEAETGFIGEHLRILTSGTRIEPFPCSELGNRPDCDDEPFRLQNEAFQAHYLGKSSAVYVWRENRYLRIVTAD